MRVSLLVGALLLSCPVLAQDRAVAGFRCVASNGATKNINIDLKKRRFDDGSGYQKIPEATATTIILRRSGADTMGDNGGFGPLFENLSLDRRSLVLTHWLAAPLRNLNRTDLYQCVIGDIVDFSAGRQF